MKEASVIAVSSHHIRIDLYDESAAPNSLDRFTQVIDVETAMKLAILLMKAIDESNIAAAQKLKRKKTK